MNAIKTKNKLYKGFKIGALPKEQYKQYRNTLNYTIKQVKQTYYLDKFTRFKNNTTMIWKIINQLSEERHKNKDIEHIFHSNENISGTSEVSKSFNEFYTNIATKLDHNLAPPTTNLLGNYPTSMTAPTVYPQDVI